MLVLCTLTDVFLLQALSSLRDEAIILSGHMTWGYTMVWVRGAALPGSTLAWRCFIRWEVKSSPSDPHARKAFHYGQTVPLFPRSRRYPIGWKKLMGWGAPLFKWILGEEERGLIFHMVNVPNPLFSPLMANCVLCSSKSHESLLSRNVNVLIELFLTSLIHLISLIYCRALWWLIGRTYDKLPLSVILWRMWWCTRSCCLGSSMGGTCPCHPAVTLQLQPWRHLGAEPAHETRQALDRMDMQLEASQWTLFLFSWVCIFWMINFPFQ